MNQLPPAPDQTTLSRRLVQAVVLTAIMLSTLACYLLVLRWRGGAALITTWTPLDEYLPFWPSWIFVYLCPYLLAPLVAAMMSRSTFRWYVSRGLAIVAVTLVIFIVFPTQTDSSHRNGNVSHGVMGAIYKDVVEVDDPPANAAPSLHISLSCLLLWALLRDYPRWWLLWAGFIGLVWLSTLLTRQHHLIDVVTGILLASAVAVCPFFPWSSKHGSRFVAQ